MRPSWLGALGFAVAATFWPGMSGAAEQSRWVTLSILLPVALFFVKIRWTAAHSVAAGLLAWMAITSAWSPIHYDAVDGMWKLIVIAMAFTLGAGITPSTSVSLRPVYRGLGLGLWLSSFIAILQWFGWHPVVTAGLPHPSGLWVNPNVMGEIASPVALALMACGDWWIALGVAPSVLLPMARGALGSLGLVGTTWAFRRGGRRSVAFILALLVAVGLGIALKTHEDTTATPQRIALTLDTLKGLRFWGNGVGSYYALFPRDATHTETINLRPNHAHNDFLELAFEGGFPAVFLAGVLVYLAFRRGRTPERMVLAAICLEGLVGFPLYSPATAFLFGLVAGHAAGSRDYLRLAVDGGRLALLDSAGVERHAIGLSADGEGSAALPVQS